VVRARDFAALTSLLSAAAALDGERQRVLAEAQAAIAESQAQAQREIEGAVQAAEAERERGYQAAFQQGLADATERWTALALREAGSSQRRLERQSDRLATMVSTALERVIEPDDRSALYRRALRTITPLLREVPMLTLRVAALDLALAQRAVDALLQGLPEAPHIEVLGDAALPAGSCLFESDQGTIDAGLETQLAAIQRAVARAAQQMAIEVSELAAPAATADAAEAPDAIPAAEAVEASEAAEAAEEAAP
jgi:type III secretion protein L